MGCEGKNDDFFGGENVLELGEGPRNGFLNSDIGIGKYGNEVFLKLRNMKYNPKEIIGFTIEEIETILNNNYYNETNT